MCQEPIADRCQSMLSPFGRALTVVAPMPRGPVQCPTVSPEGIPRNARKALRGR
jgi:hypothetical protein